MADYKYDVVKNSSTFYKCVNGVVTTQAAPFFFTEGIHNFNEQGVKHKRNMLRGGFVTSYMDEDYQFTGDLQKLMKHIFFTEGPDAVATLRIWKCINYKTKEYAIEYESQIDFTTAMSMSNQFAVHLMQGGVYDMMATRGDTRYTILLNSSNTTNVRIQPIRLYGNAKYLTFHQDAGSGSDTQGNQQGGGYAWPSIQQYDESYTEVEDSPNTRPIDFSAEIPVRAYIKGQQILSSSTGVWDTTPGSYQNFLFRTNVPLDKCRIKLTLPSFIKNNDSGNSLTVSARIYKYNEAIANSESNIATFNLITYAPSGQGSHTFTIDHTFSLPANHRIYILLEATHTDWEWNWEKDKKVEVDYEYFSGQFMVKGVNLLKVAQQLALEMTNGQATLTSSLLTQDITYAEGIDCKPARMVLLSGDTIRQVAGQAQYLKISWNDLMKALDMWFCAGWDVYDGSKVIIERRSHFFNKTKLIANLGEAAKDPNVTFADDLAYNEFHIGYPDFEYDNINGREEYNTRLKMITGHIRTMNGTNETNVKEVLCPFRADTFGIYNLWVKYVLNKDNNNKDSQGDSEIFALQHENTGWALYPSDIKAGLNLNDIQGVTDKDLILNIGLTPKRCLIRRAYWEISHFYNNTTTPDKYRFRFLTLDKNATLRTKISTTDFIDEDADEELEQLLTKYGQERAFYPYYIESQHVSPLGYAAMWMTNRYGYFITVIDGVAHKGYPVTSDERNVQPRLSGFKLLLTGDENPATFI